MTLTQKQCELLATVLTYHQPTNTSGCHCGWAVLGASHAEHVVAVYVSVLMNQERQARDPLRRTPSGMLPSNYHDLVPAERDLVAICPPGEHSYGWESDDATYCECGVQICGHVSVNAGDTYVCVRSPHESNVGHMVALR